MVTHKLAEKVQIRDDYECQYCGKDGLASIEAWHDCTVDHFVPVKKGGTEDESNLVTCCGHCNAIKGKMKFDTMDEAREYIKKRKAELEVDLQRARERCQLARGHIDKSKNLNNKNVVKFDELLITVMHIQEALIDLLTEKGLIDKKELETKTAQKIIEAKQKKH